MQGSASGNNPLEPNTDASEAVTVCSAAQSDQGEQLSEYRRLLVSAEQKAQEDYDKTVLTLSGGALAVSFAFVKDILGEGPILQVGWLVAAWVQWAISVTSMLVSFYVSRWALRETILQCDAEVRGEECGPPGNKFVTTLRVLNAAGALFFVLGVLAMTVFVSCNIGQRSKAAAPKALPEALPAVNLYLDFNGPKQRVETVMSDKQRPSNPPPKSPPPSGPHHANDKKPTRGYEPPPRPPERRK
jgi:hypothetical protein